MNRIFTMFALVAAMMLATSAFGQGDLKQRIMSRLPQVEALKKAGTAGENNKGLLEARGALSSSQSAIMRAENDDRLKLYQSIAAKTGVTVAEVGQRRALEIVKNSTGGVWVQKPNGEWMKAN